MNCYASVLTKCNCPNSRKMWGCKMQISMHSIKPFFLDLNQGSVNQQEEQNAQILHRQPAVPITDYLILKTRILLVPHIGEIGTADSNRKAS